MLILKRLAVWSLERLVEVSLLGGLFGCLLSLSSGEKRLTLRDSLAGFWVLGLAVAIVLFLHGYYVTTAFFGVVWRSAKTWVYPTITPALFVFHPHRIYAFRIRFYPGSAGHGASVRIGRRGNRLLLRSRRKQRSKQVDKCSF